MPSTFAQHLKGAITALSTDDRHRLLDRLGIARDIGRRACLAFPIPVTEHLKLCAVMGMDPVTGEIIKNDLLPLGNFHKESFACALRMTRIRLNWSLRAAEAKIGVSYSALRRIEKGEATSADNVLTVMRFMQRNPFDFVSREKSVAQSVMLEPERVSA